MDLDKYEDIVEQYIDMIYRIALNSCKNKYDADDVVQNTFMKLLKYKKEFDNEEHIRNWLIRVAINECKTMWMSIWKTRVTKLPEVHDVPLQENEKSEELLQQVWLLPVKYREVMYLYYYEEFSVKEVANILKISETAVQTRLQRGRQKLKIILEVNYAQ